ncbi:MAG: CaiB/BaiF CoA-transferase family protein, partial [Ruthenibacterium sp.]
EGEKVDVSLVDSMVSSLEIINMIYLCTGRVPGRIGNRYEAIYPYDSFKASDGYAIIACGNDKLYNALVDLLHLPGMEEERFSCNINRVENHAPLKEIIEQWTATKTIDEIVEMLLAAGIPAAPINTIDRVTKDPHIAGAREMFVECEHPVAGKIKITGSQFKFNNHKFTVKRPAPLLGQHNKEILTSLGRTEEEIKRYQADGVL